MARQIDALHVDVAITALSLSPNMDVLATTHVDQNGVYLWVNQAMFTGASSIDSYSSGKEIVSVKLPSSSSAEGSEVNDVDDGNPKRSHIKETAWTLKFDQKIPDLVTLSLLPKTQWQSLINLDIIKVRNKPTEPPKKPEKTPFFLPSIPSLSGDIMFRPSEGIDEDLSEKDANPKSRITTDSPLSSPFVQVLQSAVQSKNFSAFTDYIKGLSPSALDLELRMLQIIDDDGLDDHDDDNDDDDEPEMSKKPELVSLEMLMDYLIHEVSCRNNFEFVQAVVRLFLKIHGETVRCQLTLQEKAKKLLETQYAVWQGVDKLFQSARCMVAFLSNSQF